MKFINYIEKISGIEIMGMISLLMFVSFFTIMLIWVFRTNKNKLKEISQIPLDNY
jgi:cytochrome c oxidase cbb3-type subunit IV